MRHLRTHRTLALGLLLALTLAACSNGGTGRGNGPDARSSEPVSPSSPPADGPTGGDPPVLAEPVRLAAEGRADALAELLAGPDGDRLLADHGTAALKSVTDRHTEDVLAVLAAAGAEGEPALGQAFWRSATALPKDPAGSLLAAATSGDVAQVAAALRAGADPETRDPRRRTPLLLAATDDRVPVARLLVRRGADPDALDERHDTPWLVTGVTGSVAMGKVLLAAGADLTVRNRYGGVSVIPASERGHADYVEWVVGTDIDLDHVNDLGWTALLEAVVLGDGGPRHQRIVEALLGGGADPSIADRDGVTPLQHARTRGQDAVVRILEQH